MPAAFDVFVSYSSRDRPVVETIAQRLRDARLTPWFDRWALTAGVSWQEEIAAGIAGSSACAVCIGAGDVGDWSREELEIALVRAADDRGFRVFVVLLPGVGDAFDPSKLSPFLVTRTWVDLRNGLGDLQPLINAVRGVPASSGAPTPVRQANPYRGLRPFEEQDANTFFGRDAETQQALEKLRTARFLAVVGASGSGKSSLVRAGIIPALRAASGWTVVVLKPGSAPLESLAVHLPGADARAAREQMRAGVDGLHLLGRVALADRPDETRLLVVIDQFEEVFTRCRDEDERRRFIENLAYAATAPDGRVVVVLTLRADFYPRCAAHPELAHLLASHQALLGPMSADALREAIETPAHAAGGEFEAGLVDLLLSEVSGRPGALPLLEHTLYELWEHRSGRMLTLEAYQRAGGVSGAVAHRAEAIFTALSAEEQAIARRVLLRLTEPGEGTEDTRRRAEFDELVRSDAETRAVTHVVGALADGRLLTTDEHVVDVAHEALIRGWPRLRGWIDEDREGLRIHRRLAETAEEWERLKRDPGLLFRGVRLAEARELDAGNLNERERAFLAASGAQEVSELEQVREFARTRQRAARRLVWAAAILLVGVVASGVAAVWAVQARNDAREQATTALARQLSAQAREAVGTRIDDALLRALAAVRLRPGADTEAALADVVRSEHRLTAVLRPSGPEVQTLAANESEAVTVDAAGAVTRWDLKRHRASGPPLRVPKFTAAAVSGDLRVLVTGAADGRVRFWDLTTWRSRPPGRRVMDGSVDDLALDRAGARLVATSNELGVNAWTVGATLERIPHLRAGPSGDIRLSADGRRAVIVPYSGRTRVVDVRTGRRLATLPSDVFDAFLTDDGRRLVTSDEQAHDQLRALDGRILTELRLSGMAYSPDGRRMLGTFEDGSVVVGATKSGRSSAPLTGLTLDTAVFAGSDQVVTAGADGALGLWSLDAAPAAQTRRLPGFEIVAGDGRLAAAREVGALRFVDVATGAPRGHVRLPADMPVTQGIGVSPGGRFLAIVGYGKSERLELAVWDRRRGGAPVRLPFGGGSFSAMGFSRDGTQLAAISFSGSLRVWDLAARWPPRPTRNPTSEPLDSGVAAPAGPGTDQVAFTPDGRHVLAHQPDTSRIKEFDVRTGRSRAVAPALTFAVAADGRSAATVDTLGRVWLWRLPSWQRAGAPLTRIAGLSGSLGLSADGHRLAVGGTGSAVTVWDTATRTRVASLQAGAADEVTWNGDRLVTVSYSEGARVWDLSGGALRRRACAVANRDVTREEWRALVGPDRPYAKLC